MRENFKLRKMKVGLVSVAIAAMYITMQGQAEASESGAEANQPTAKQSIVEKQVETNPQLNTETQVNSTVQPPEQVDAKQKETKEDAQENFVKLNQVQPGDTKITGKTVPNQIVSLTLDGKSVGSVAGENDGFTTASESGDFEFDLKDYNQKVDVSSSNFNFELEDEGSEDEMMEEEVADATDTATTGRYDKAYEIPTQQLEKKNGHHQVLVEPILKDSGIIKGHTSVKGRVALSINNKFVDLGFDDFDKNTPLEKAKSRNEGIWKYIDDKGYFEFDFKRKPFENYQLKKDDLVSLTFKPDDEEDALIPLIFNVKASDFDTVASATTTYRPNDVKKVVTLNNGADDLEVENIHGFVYESDRGIDKPVEGGQGTRIIKGKTKFANAVVNVTSSLGEGNEFPDLQVDEKGEFSFNASEAGYRLNNGEKLHFTVVDPLSGKILSKLVTKEIEVAETDEQRKNREMDELLEVTPAYFKIVGDELRGYDTLGNVLVYFDANDKTAINDYLNSLGLDKLNLKKKPELTTDTKHEIPLETKLGALPKATSMTQNDASSETSADITNEITSVITPKTNAHISKTSKSSPSTETTSVTSTDTNVKSTFEKSDDTTVDAQSVSTSESNADVRTETTSESHSEATLKAIPVTTLDVSSSASTTVQPAFATTQSSSKVTTLNESNKLKALPETGNENTHTGWIGAVLIGLGVVFFTRRKHQSHSK